MGAISVTRWLEWGDYGVIAITPGLIAAVAAACLIILSSNSERTLSSIDWLTLLFAALFRYTTQVCESSRLENKLMGLYHNLLNILSVKITGNFSHIKQNENGERVYCHVTFTRCLYIAFCDTRLNVDCVLVDST